MRGKTMVKLEYISEETSIETFCGCLSFFATGVAGLCVAGLWGFVAAIALWMAMIPAVMVVVLWAKRLR
jgi:hypothetical protein